MIMDAAKLKAATTYNAAADHFDDEPLGFWARIGRRTIECLELPIGATVLDVGCGTGASALPAAEKVGPQGRVIGVDLAERLLEIARQKAEEHGLANINFEIGDMERLGYPLPQSDRGRSAGRQSRACDPRQLRRPQASQCATMAQSTRALHIPLHANVVFMAQRRRRLLRKTHQAAIEARCLRLGRRSAGRHQSLRRRTQYQAEALHLDR